MICHYQSISFLFLLWTFIKLQNICIICFKLHTTVNTNQCTVARSTGGVYIATKRAEMRSHKTLNTHTARCGFHAACSDCSWVCRTHKKKPPQTDGNTMLAEAANSNPRRPTLGCQPAPCARACLCIFCPCTNPKATCCACQLVCGVPSVQPHTHTQKERAFPHTWCKPDLE